MSDEVKQPKRTPLQIFLEAASKLSDSERLELEEIGWQGPNQTDSATVENWGYLCSHCNEVAIQFRGAKFRHPDGSVQDSLPPGAPLNKLPWVQKTSESFPKTLISRENPICPACHKPVSFDGGAEKFLKARLIRSITEHQRVESQNRQQIEAHRRGARRVPVGAKLGAPR